MHIQKSMKVTSKVRHSKTDRIPPGMSNDKELFGFALFSAKYNVHVAGQAHMCSTRGI